MIFEFQFDRKNFILFITKYLYIENIYPHYYLLLMIINLYYKIFYF